MNCILSELCQITCIIRTYIWIFNFFLLNEDVKQYLDYNLQIFKIFGSKCSEDIEKRRIRQENGVICYIHQTVMINYEQNFLNSSLQEIVNGSHQMHCL